MSEPREFEASGRRESHASGHPGTVSECNPGAAARRLGMAEGTTARCADRAGHSWEAGGETPSAGLQWSRDLGLPDHAAASVEPSGSGDADVVWTAPEVEHVGALFDRRWAGRAPTTHVPVR